MELINLEEFPINLKDYPTLERKLPKRNYPSDFTNDKINNNTIIGLAGMCSKSHSCLWLCRCDCGTFHLLRAGYLHKIKSCKKCSVKRLGWKWADSV